MAAWVSSVLNPLVAELRLSRETIAEQAERLGYVAAERDAARAELTAERAAKSTPAVSGAPETGAVPQEPPIPLSRLLTRWLVLALVLVGVLGTVVALVVWPR